MKWVPVDGETEDIPVFGEYENADLEVEVHYYKDCDEPDIVVRCLCAACHDIEMVGVVDAMGVDKLEEGVHYLKHWHETSHHWEYGPMYESGLAHNRKEGT